MHPEYVEIVVDLKLGLTQKRSEGPAFVSLYLLAYLVNERFFHARTRKKSFSFFRHYLSLFLMFYIICLYLSEIDGVMDA